MNDDVKVPSTKRILLIGFPVMAFIFGLVGWSAVAIGAPNEPHPELYGLVTAGTTLAYMYIRTWFDFRKDRRQPW